MPYLLAMVEMIEPNHGLRAFTVLLEDMLAQEVDFRVEAHNRERLAAVLERSGRSARSAHADVQLPRVFWELCREGLMVQELAAAAVSLQDKAAVEAAGVPFVLAVAELAEVSPEPRARESARRFPSRLGDGISRPPVPPCPPPIRRPHRQPMEDRARVGAHPYCNVRRRRSGAPPYQVPLPEPT